MGAGVTAGDAVIIIVEDNGGAACSASGYTELAFVSNAGGGAGGTELTVLGKIAGGGEGSASVTANVNHNTGRSIIIQDHGLSAITDCIVGADNTGAVATGTALGITVTADSMVLICCATTADTASTAYYSAFTNANFASITERMDNVIATGSGGGIGMASATCAGTTTGSSTWTNATAEAWCGVHIGIPPVAAAVVDANIHYADRSIYA